MLQNQLNYSLIAFLFVPSRANFHLFSQLSPFQEGLYMGDVFSRSYEIMERNPSAPYN